MFLSIFFVMSHFDCPVTKTKKSKQSNKLTNWPKLWKLSQNRSFNLEKIPSFLNLTWTRKMEDGKLGDTSKNETSHCKNRKCLLKAECPAISQKLNPTVEHAIWIHSKQSCGSLCSHKEGWQMSPPSKFISWLKVCIYVKYAVCISINPWPVELWSDTCTIWVLHWCKIFWRHILLEIVLGYAQKWHSMKISTVFRSKLK